MNDQLENAIAQIRLSLANAIRARIGWQVAAAGGLLIWIGLLIDRWFEPTSQVRFIAMLFVLGAGLFWWLIRCLPTIIYRPKTQELIGVIAKARPDLADSLLAAHPSVELADSLSEKQREQTNEFNRTNRARVNQALHGFDAERIFKSPKESPYARVAKLSWLAALMLGMVFPSQANLYLKRIALANEPWPRAVRLVPEGLLYDADNDVWMKYFARGTSVELLVWADLLQEVTPPEAVRVKALQFVENKLPDSLLRVGEPTYREQKSFNVNHDATASNRVKSQKYRLRLDDLHRSLTLRLRGADDQIVVRLIASDRPKIDSARLVITPPSYLNREPYTYEASQLRALPEGSFYKLLAQTNHPLREVKASWLDSEAKANAMLVVINDFATNPSRFQFNSYPLTSSGDLAIELTDHHHIKSSPPYVLAIDLVKDEPPTVTTFFEGIGKLMTPNARLKVLVDAKDDYQLSTVRLMIDKKVSEAIASDSQSNSQANGIIYEESISLPDKGSQTISATQTIDFELLGASEDETQKDILSVGDELRLYAEAADAYDLSQRNPSRSESRLLRVVSPQEFLNHLNERERELRKTLEGVLADARRLAYSLERSLVERDVPNFVGEWSLETNKVKRDIENIVAKVKAIRSEAIQNRIEQTTFIERLAESVVQPLEKLLKEDLLPMTAQLNESLQASKPVNDLASISRSSQQVVRVVEQVIEAMQSNESYNEVVATLRRLLRNQKQLNQKTANQQKEEALRDLLD